MNKSEDLISPDFLFSEETPEERKPEPVQEPQKPEPDLESILVALTDFSSLDAALSAQVSQRVSTVVEPPRRINEPIPFSEIKIDGLEEISAPVVPAFVVGVRNFVSDSVSAPAAVSLSGEPRENSSGNGVGSESSRNDFSDREAFLSEKEKERVESVRNLRKELSDIFSECEGFPPFHKKTILNLVDAVCVRTVQKEIETLGTLLLYFSETLGVILDKREAWERLRKKFVENAYVRVKAQRGLGFRLIPKRDALENPEVLDEALESFNSAYAKKRDAFISELKRSWAVSSSPMRIDYSGNEWGKTVFACLEKTVSLWRRAYDESRLIGGDLLVLKMENIMSEYYDNFSDVMKAAEEEHRIRQAKSGVFVPKTPRARKTIAIPVGQTIPTSLEELTTVPEEVEFSKGGSV